MANEQQNNVGSLVLKLGVATFSRLILNTARRFPYTFVLVLSRGLGVPLTAVTSLIAVNQATSLLGMVFGPVADRLGYRLMMLLGLGLLSAGMLAGGFMPYYAVVMAALFLAGLGKSMFDPALQAYVGERVPYHRRGLAVGLLEVSWAASTLVGIPLVGLLIDRFAWRAPFFTLGGLGLLAMVLLGLLIPKEDRKAVRGGTSGSILGAWQRLVRERHALGMLGYSFFVAVANDNLFVVYAPWLERSFELSVVALGVSASVIGVAELVGEGLTASLADRIGLKRSVAVGSCICALAYMILPFAGYGSLSAALAGLFAVFLTFEFTIVSCLSLCTELLPDSRATMMSGYLASAGLGRVLGAMIGGPVWMAGGMVRTGLVSTGFTILAVLLLLWGMRNWKGR